MNAFDTLRMKAWLTICALDVRVLLWCFDRRHIRSLVLIARGLSRSGDGYLQVGVPVVVWSMGHASGKDFALQCLYLFTIERCLYWSLKNSLCRPRPPATIPSFLALVHAADRFSFPSGHTSAAFLLATLVYSLDSVTGSVLFVWATLVGLSRVVLGVHYPSDIVAGMVLGPAVAVFMPAMV